MIEQKGTDFYESFMRCPRRVYLFGTNGAIKMYIPYIKILRKYGIEPVALVSDDENMQNKSVLGIRVISQDEWAREADDNQYIIISNSAKRFKDNALNYIAQKTFTQNINVWSDFPFKMNFLDYPYPRSWSEETSWFYDVLYAGLKKYDMNPQRYIEQVFQHNGLTVNGGAFVMQDYHSDYVNVANGERYTPNQPEVYENNVYIVGSCIAYGDRCDDASTIASKLQIMLNRDYGDKYCVHNYGAILVPINNLICLLKTLDIKAGDKVILIDLPRIIVNSEEMNTINELAKIYMKYLSDVNNYCKDKNCEFYFMWLPVVDVLKRKTNFERQIEKHIPRTIAQHREKYNLFKSCGMHVPELPRFPKSGGNGVDLGNVLTIAYTEFYSQLAIGDVPFVDLNEWFSLSHEYVEIYGDRVHMAYMGCQYVGYLTYDIVFKRGEKKKDNANAVSYYDSIVASHILTDEFREYLDNLKRISVEKIGQSGIIVMNCNPFTKGHKYLIETASKQVDNLYVLVVEEDKSAFKFKDRFAMVKEGVKDIENVTVLNSGRFVISSLTFPEYFTKETNKDTEFDASKDLYNFCKFIAPALKATKRFVGEEPLDIVTNQYNEQMKRFLPEYGIELSVVPRKETMGGVISATRGRKYIEAKDMDGVNMIFPETTVNYLKENGFL